MNLCPLILKFVIKIRMAANSNVNLLKIPSNMFIFVYWLINMNCIIR